MMKSIKMSNVFKLRVIVILSYDFAYEHKQSMWTTHRVAYSDHHKLHKIH